MRPELSAVDVAYSEGLSEGAEEGKGGDKKNNAAMNLFDTPLAPLNRGEWCIAILGHFQSNMNKQTQTVASKKYSLLYLAPGAFSSSRSI
ncbi:MAG: hypothetical protein COW03_01150 [Cytophagales bacterium CG12_big_fil_rev_8_21_14_0_65_40_12]|nr:MAG: hypothetical protein COW03_01150 [Cytophagales bacterium CG12_big_fil_rev_8_21_14_0_65_40_12]PIW03891.1 MAG: hypothetical protein COW40_12050 [Cytophagales bacterium CG17_big_fil_post_rev_8_21_14_2_50_40_13]